MYARMTRNPYEGDFRLVMMFNISVISELDSHLKLDMACIADLESVRIVISGQSNG